MARDLESPLEAWDRQDGESARAYAAFVQYRDMGPARSLRKMMAVEPRMGAWTSLSRWSSENSWVDRVAAWEIEQRRTEMLEQTDKVKGMRRAHAGIGTLMLAKAAQKINAITPESLTVREAVMLAELGAKLERQARGEPDATLQVEANVNVRPANEVITSDTLWRMLRDNPHLADTMATVERAIEIAAVATPPSEGESDDDVVEAEILDDTGTDGG